MISAPNGWGKSNILEAISYLSIGKSIRGAQDQQAVPFGGKYFDIQGKCENGPQIQTLRIFFDKTKGKTAFCEEVPLARVSEVLGRFRTVHFSPEDVALVLRFPAERRRLLDILLSQYSPQYLRDLQRYHRVLAQRNHLLRENRGSRLLTEIAAVLDPWTNQLAKLGASLRFKRREVLKAIENPFSRYCDLLSTTRERVAIEYRGSQALEEGALAEELRQELEECQQQELQVGHTLCGPHRDDLVFLVNGRPADLFASGGQLKSILIAWKLGEVHFLEEPPGNRPVLLLDDAFSELDKQRAKALLEIIDGFEQVLVTTSQEMGREFSSRFEKVRLPD